MTNASPLSFRKANPALVRGLVVAVIGLLASFGLVRADVLDEAQLGYVVMIGTVVLPILQGLWTRYGVTPNAKVVAQVTAAGDVVAGDAAAITTGSVIATEPNLGGTGRQIAEPVVVKPELTGD